MDSGCYTVDCASTLPHESQRSSIMEWELVRFVIMAASLQDWWRIVTIHVVCHQSCTLACCHPLLRIFFNCLQVSMDSTALKFRWGRAARIDDICSHKTTPASMASLCQIFLPSALHMQSQPNKYSTVSDTNRMYGCTRGHVVYMMDGACCIVESRSHCSLRRVGWSCEFSQPIADRSRDLSSSWICHLSTFTEHHVQNGMCALFAQFR